LNFQHPARNRAARSPFASRRAGPAPSGGCHEPRPALCAQPGTGGKQTLLDQLHALATDDPDFLTDVLEGETNLLELIAALDASIIDDETLVDGANPRIGGLIRTSDECYSPGRETAVERRGRFLASRRRDDPTSSSGQFERRFRRL
jgi:hypothetical protein